MGFSPYSVLFNFYHGSQHYAWRGQGDAKLKPSTIAIGEWQTNWAPGGGPVYFKSFRIFKFTFVCLVRLNLASLYIFPAYQHSQPRCSSFDTTPTNIHSADSLESHSENQTQNTVVNGIFGDLRWLTQSIRSQRCLLLPWRHMLLACVAMVPVAKINLTYDSFVMATPVLGQASKYKKSLVLNSLFRLPVDFTVFCS